MRGFRQAVEDCSLQDLGFSGVSFTWDNKQQGNANVKARLDRSFVNAEFLQLFEMARVKHISSVESDHCFVLTQLRQAGRQSINAQSYFGQEFVAARVWPARLTGSGFGTKRNVD
jgi:hypothetical protein